MKSLLCCFELLRCNYGTLFASTVAVTNNHRFQFKGSQAWFGIRLGSLPGTGKGTYIPEMLLSFNAMRRFSIKWLPAGVSPSLNQLDTDGRLTFIEVIRTLALALTRFLHLPTKISGRLPESASLTSSSPFPLPHLFYYSNYVRMTIISLL